MEVKAGSPAEAADAKRFMYAFGGSTFLSFSLFLFYFYTNKYPKQNLNDITLSRETTPTRPRIEKKGVGERCSISFFSVLSVF